MTTSIAVVGAGPAGAFCAWRLAAAGMEVVPYETLREDSGYKSLGPVLRTKQEPLGTQTGKSLRHGGRSDR